MASQQEQLQAQSLFNQNFAAINKAKQQTGDWEKAYEMVTGTRWPKGHNVEITPQGAQITKDRGVLGTIGSVASKVAPIAAGLIPGVGPIASMAIGAAAGAGGRALSGGSLGDIVKGGITGGAMSGAGSILKGAMAGKGIPGLSNVPGLNKIPGVAAAPQGAQMTPAIQALMGKANVPMGSIISDVNAKSQGPGSWISRLLGGAKSTVMNPMGGGTNADGWADLSSLIGSFGQAEASNRATRGQFMQNYDQIALNYDRQNLAREGDAMRKLGQTSYILGGGNPYQAPVLRSGSTVDLGYGPKAPSPAEIQGAQSLQGTLLNRLAPEGALKPTDPNSYVKEGMSEKIAKYGALGTGGIGAARTIWG